MKLPKFVNPLLTYPAIRLQRYSTAFLLKNDNSLRYLSTERLEEEEPMDLTIRERILLRRPILQKYKRPPFVKNLFLGKLDTNLLSFPEVLNKDHLQEIDHYVQTINESYKKIDSSKIEADRKIPTSVFDDFRDIGLYGRIVPQSYGGLGLTHTECVRLNEAVGIDWSVGLVFTAHEFIIQAMLQLGTEKQKETYLPDLVSGRKSGVLCSYETVSSGSDISGLQTTAEMLPGGNYVLNGKKDWVTDAEQTDIFVVSAKNITEASGVSLFIVDSKSEGVKVTPHFNKTSLCGSMAGTVNFKNVVVPTENVLGNLKQGVEHLYALQEFLRFGVSTMTFGVLKALVDNVVQYIIKEERTDTSMSDYHLVRTRLSRVVQTIYAMESVSYFTAAIYDTTEVPDCAVESAVMKVFNTENTLFCLRELINAVGTQSFSKDHPIERFYRDAQALTRFEAPTDLSRLYIGLAGCQYAGKNTADMIKRHRNPFFYPWDRIKLLMDMRRISKKKYKYDQDIAGHLHPSSVEYGNKLEERVQMLMLAVNRMLTDHAKRILEFQCDAIKLADMAIEIYAVTAVLARSSRSYCIGLKNSREELKLAHTFCHEALNRVEKMFTEVMMGIHHNNDANHLYSGEAVVTSRGYFPEHPLKHNL